MNTQRVSTHLMWQPLTGDVRGETRLAFTERAGFPVSNSNHTALLLTSGTRTTTYHQF